jgi:hypothetical protein
VILVRRLLKNNVGNTLGRAIRARNGMAAMARTPVLPEATRARALSALSCPLGSAPRTHPECKKADFGRGRRLRQRRSFRPTNRGSAGCALFLIFSQVDSVRLRSAVPAAASAGARTGQMRPRCRPRARPGRTTHRNCRAKILAASGTSGLSPGTSPTLRQCGGASWGALAIRRHDRRPRPSAFNRIAPPVAMLLDDTGSAARIPPRHRRGIASKERASSMRPTSSLHDSFAAPAPFRLPAPQTRAKTGDSLGIARASVYRALEAG